MERMKPIAKVLPLALGLFFAEMPAQAEVLETSAVSMVNQQVAKVTGTVVDGEGYPLIGVNVLEKGHQSNGKRSKKDW